MLYYPLAFLMIGVIVTTMNLVGTSAVAIQASWILLLIGMVSAAIHMVTWHPGGGA